MEMRALKVIGVVSLATLCCVAAHAASCTQKEDTGDSPRNHSASLPAGPVETVDFSAIRSALMGKDFSTDLRQVAVCLDGPADPVIGPFTVGYDKLAPPDSYSRGEKMLLGGWKHSSGMHMNLAATFELARGFDAVNDRLPRDGAELAAWVETSRAGTTAAVAREELASPKALTRFGYAVNPVSGKVFESFSNGDWHPGGVYFKRIETPEELEAAFAGRPGFSTCHGPDFVEAWLIVAFGESDGVILGSKPIVLKKPKPDTKFQGMDAAPEGPLPNPCAAQGN
jgi:hypothetical protein